ncbi:WD40 repeat domain-containing protein [Nocardia sp. GCM10030253]|uniref:WD40 repeat domain-containing protein n=1 Tax=Nocardia sp. GCM10030253 TaxID=3273404 RepID=UPI0036422B31
MVDPTALSEAAEHRRAVAALIATIRSDRERANPYIVNRLSAHVAASGAWEDLAAADDIIDWLNPDVLVADLMRSGFGTHPLPTSLAGLLPVRAVLGAATPADRATLRAIAAARLTEQHTSVQVPSSAMWALGWTRLDRAPSHVVLDLAAKTHDPDTLLSEDSRRGLAAVAAPDGRALLASFEGSRLRFWDPATAAPVGEPIAFREPIIDIAAASEPSARGVLIVAAGTDVWRLSTTSGRPIGPSSSHPERVSAIACGEGTNGQSIMATAAGTDIRLWDVATGQQLGDLRPQDSPIRALAVLRRNDTPALAVAHRDLVRVIDLSTGKARHRRWRQRQIAVGEGDIEQMSILPVASGRVLVLALVTVVSFGTLRTYDAWTGRLVDQPVSELATLDFAVGLGQLGGRALVAVAGRFGMLRVLDPVRMELLGADLIGHDGKVQAAVLLAPRQGHNLLATVGTDRTIRLWSLEEALSDRPGSQRPVPTVDIRRIRFRGVAAQIVGTRAIIGARSTRNLPPQVISDGEWTHFAGVAVILGRDGRELVAAGTDQGFVHMFDAATGAAAEQPLRVLEASLWHLARVPTRGGDMMATYGGIYGEDGWTTEGRLWNPRTRQRAGSDVGFPTELLDLGVGTAFRADERRVAVAGLAHGFACCWDLDTTRPLTRKLPIQVRSVAPVELSNGSTVLATGDVDGLVLLWNPLTGALIAKLGSHHGVVRALATVRGPDGACVVVSYGDDDTLRVWDPTTRTERHRLVLGIAVRALAAAGSRVFLAGNFGLLALDLNRDLAP